MTPAEIRAVSRLGGHAFAGLVSRIEQVHQAIGGRAFAPMGPAGVPGRLLHDSIARGVYVAVRAAGPAAGVIAGEVMSLSGAGGQARGRKPAASLVLAALNAVAGDQLGPDLAPLAIRMAVRADGCDLDLTAHEVAHAFPHATRTIAVFVHGLAETEDSWHRRASQSQPYGPRLEAEFGYTPVYVRYNTGLHVSENGHDLAGLLESLLAVWPGQVDEILLVGHSMGGLVIRSACHYGRQACAAWVERVRHVFYLGSPHTGAPLARAAGYAGWALAKVAETRPFAALVAGSSSIRDLRHGYVLDEDWAGCDQNCCQRDHHCGTPLLAGADHCVISATITADPDHPFGTVVGDLLVQPASAQGRRGARQHIPFPAGLGRGLGGMHHFDLLNHPGVWAAMRSQLRRPARTTTDGHVG
jgi:pimeloyl-ACP methyl ester carboxylesterase